MNCNSFHRNFCGLFALAALFLARPAHSQFNATWSFLDTFGNQLPITTMEIDSLLAYTVNGTNIVLGDNHVYPVSNATLTVNGMYPGQYRTIYSGEFLTITFTNSFPLGTTGSVSASGFVVNSLVPPIPVTNASFGPGVFFRVTTNSSVSWTGNVDTNGFLAWLTNLFAPVGSGGNPNAVTNNDTRALDLTNAGNVFAGNFIGNLITGTNLIPDGATYIGTSYALVNLLLPETTYQITFGNNETNLYSNGLGAVPFGIIPAVGTVVFTTGNPMDVVALHGPDGVPVTATIYAVWTSPGPFNATNLYGVVPTNNLPMSQLGGGSGTYNYNLLSNTPTLGNAASANTNTMKVFGATNADNATTATNAPNGFPLVSNPFIYQQGGSPLLLDLQASAPMALNGQSWGATGRKPILMIYTGQAHGATLSPYADFNNETNTLTILSNWTTNGLLGAFTNDGGRVYFFHETGWDNLRNTNWPYMVSNITSLVWDTNRFSHGIPWINQVCLSNNIGSVWMIYSLTNIVPTGASEWIISWDASNPILYTNGVGPVPTNGFGHYETVSTPADIQHDLDGMLWWGCAGVCTADDPAVVQSLFQISYDWGKAALCVYLPFGFNQSYPAAAYPGNTAAMALVFTNQYPQPYPSTFAFGVPTPIIISYESFPDQYRTVGAPTTPNHTAVYYDNGGEGVGNVGVLACLRDFPTTTKAWQGSYIVDFLPDDVSTATAVKIALLHQWPMLPPDNYPISWNHGMFKSATNFLLNAAWRKIWLDDEQNWPKPLWPGNTNTFIEQIVAGNWVVGYFNKYGSTVSTQSVNWSNFHWLTNTIVDVKEIYPLNIDYGTNSISYTNIIAAGDSQLFEFDSYGATYIAGPSSISAPTNLLNTVAWWVTSDTATNAGLESVSNRVTANNWPLQSSATASYWPTNGVTTLNGSNVLTFSSLSTGYCFLTNLNFTLSPPYEVTIIYKVNNAAPRNGIAYVLGDMAGNLAIRIISDQSSYTNLQLSADAFTSFAYVSNGISVGKWRMDTLADSGTSCAYYTNGVLMTNWTSTVASPSGFVLSGYPGALYWPTPMSVAEVFVYSNVNSAFNRNLIWNYCTNKYSSANF
jgi:hypothetical protein